MIVACVGSRRITEAQKEKLIGVGSFLSRNKIACRTGDSDGVEREFQKAVGPRCTVFGVRESDRPDTPCNYQCLAVLPKKIQRISVMETLKIHPDAEALKKSKENLYLNARNYLIIMGKNCNKPVSLVLCCCPSDVRGRPLGGTGQIIRIAERQGINWINLANLTVKEVERAILKVLERDKK